MKIVTDDKPKSASNLIGEKEDDSFYNNYDNQNKKKKKPPPIPVKKKKMSEMIDSKKDNNVWDIPYTSLNLGSKIGQGAYGEVFKGLWRNQEVAVKMMKGELAISEFMEEAQLMLRLRPHDNVVLFLGVCKDPFCVVLKYYAMGSLYRYLKSEEPMKWGLQLKIMKGIAAGISHLHEEKIIHRDLASRNILLSASMEAIVSDFGFARLLKQDTTVGETNTSIGPVKHMAPECLTDHVYSEKTDVWAFGVVCWEILLRDDPYPKLTPVNTISFIIQGKRLLIPDYVNPVITELMNKCWEKEPDDRPTMQECFDVIFKLSNEFN